MIKINKGNVLASWTQYRDTPGAVYQATDDLRNALLIEQGHICAYCMRRIPVKDLGNNETSRIDHIKCRAGRPDLELEYTNMVICCPGFIDGKEHCDKSKGNSSISLPLFNIALQNSISYSSKDGTIKSSNETWNHEINNVIKLNNTRLKNNRLQTLYGIIDSLEKRKWKKAELRNKLLEYTNPDSLGMKSQYCGIVTWYLQRNLRK